ncbi:hypothetical protein WI664_00640 [Vibrio cholerae]
MKAMAVSQYHLVNTFDGRDMPTTWGGGGGGFACRRSVHQE